MRNIKSLVAGIVIGALLFGSTPIFALSGIRNIAVTYQNIKLSVDGKTVQTDAEPFLYDGRTYVPIRAVSEALGAGVKWSTATSTIEITKAPSTTTTSSTSTLVPDSAAQKTTTTEKQNVTVYITKTGSKYHTSSCRYLSKSKIPISLTTAKAQGYGPCSVCNPPR